MNEGPLPMVVIVLVALSCVVSLVTASAQFIVSLNKDNIWIFFCYICFSSENQPKNRKSKNIWIKKLLFCFSFPNFSLTAHHRVYCEINLNAVHQTSSVFLESIEY